MPDMYFFVLFVLSLLCAVFSPWKTRQRLPPGPRKLPIIGNLLQIPRGGFMWLEYAEMCRKYKSDIIHLGALGHSIIVLNSAEAVNDLLEKRSAIYSSRPQSTMIGELMGSVDRWKKIFVLRPNDDLWKAQRKIFSQALSPADPKRFHSKQLSATHELLRMLPRSDDIFNSLHINEAAATAGAPAAFYVDQITALKYIPEWFPGAGFKRQAREWKRLLVKMTEDPYSVTKARMAMGTATPSLTSLALGQIDHTQDLAAQEEIIKLAAVGAYTGGTESVVYSLEGFILAMLLNPEVQNKAHRELEQVLGPGDLPSFDDKTALPYITAIVKEVLRHNPIAPVGLPHLLTQDDIYRGYFLPKGSIIMANVWTILHDREVYPEPGLFNPSRFLDAGGNLDTNIEDPATVAFGFGRRACPGEHIALASLWIAVASILACYTIEPELDENGKPIKPKAEWYSGPGLGNHPLPFKCRFVPRSKDIEVSLGISLT